MQKKQKTYSEIMREVAPYSNMGFQLIIPILGGFFGGQALDSHYETGSFWTISLSIVGIAAGMYTFIRQALSIGKKKE